jgi:hypothetical protein
MCILIDCNSNVFFNFRFTLVSKKIFPLPVKSQDDSYSFDIAESEYDNQIAPPPTNFKGGGIIFTKHVFNKKSNMLVFNYSIQCQIMNTAPM